MTDFEVIATGLRFPEGPIAMPDGSVILVEIAAGRLTRVTPAGAIEPIAELGGGPNGAAMGPDGKCYVCNNGGFEWVDYQGLLFPGDPPAGYAGGSIQRVDLASGAVDTVYTQCGNHGLRGPNDIVFDRAGGFWFTDTGKRFARSSDRGGVYYATTDGSHIEEVLFPYEFPNGLALSPAEDALYFCETMQGRVWRFPLSESGRLAGVPDPLNADNLLYAPGGLVGYDSMAVDGAGNVCLATLFTGGVTTVAPTGELVEFVELPDPLVTNICFGGPDLQTAFITLSGTGQLIRMPWARPGLPLNYLNK